MDLTSLATLALVMLLLAASIPRSPVPAPVVVRTQPKRSHFN